MRSFDALETLDTRLNALAAQMRCPSVLDIEKAETVEVGKTYFVSAITTRNGSPWYGARVPVLGDEHDDFEFIALTPEDVPHWHIDWRFIPRELYPALVKLLLEQNGDLGYPRDTPNLQLACVVPGRHVVNVERWPLPCQRQQLRWEAVPVWLPALEEAYKDKRVCDNICPHRGISLTGAPETQDGVRVCPGHGLAWDKSGALVRRSGAK